MIEQAIEILQHDLPLIPLHQQVIVWAAKNNVTWRSWPTITFRTVLLR